MTPIVELIVLMFVVASGAMLLFMLARAVLKPKSPRRLLTLVIEERDTKRSSPSA